jgi:hypothetical protein
LGYTGYRFRWGQGFPFQRFSFVRHLAPTASQIEVRYSKHIVGCLSGATAALVGPLPTFVSTVQHHCCHSRHFCKRTGGHSSHASAEKTQAANIGKLPERFVSRLSRLCAVISRTSDGQTIR